MTDTIKFAGEYSLTKANLTSYNGASVDIIDLIHNINVYEDIYSPFMTVDILIEDQIGLYHKMPILGEELLEISLTSVDGALGLKNAVFSLYKTKDFIEKGQRGFLYTMSFISVEAIKDMNIKMSKSYKGTASQIANNLIKTEGLGTDKDVFIEESTGNLSYISNYWPPIKNLKYLCQRAMSKATNSPSYLFFENKFGFYFTSMATLKGQEPAINYFYSARMNQDVSAGMQRVEKIFIDRGVDYIQKIQNGAYGTNTVYVDPTRKSYLYKYVDFLASFEKQPRLNELPFGSNLATRRVNGAFYLNTTPTFARTGMNDENSDRWFQERIAELGAMQAIEIQIEVPGSLHVAAGMTTDLYMYTGDTPGSSNLHDVLDPIYSGRYLISAIAHSMNRERHTMILTLAKDSIVKK
ncbi:MAG TPA: hypothetical protein VFM18_15790 [Methanosarcina sp.]|nr:hypothetical protein [Methanosarcina sp.]